MSRHFMAVLGTNTYKDCIYTFDNKEFCTRFIQEAVLYFEDFKEDDKITIFLTSEARNKNYLSNKNDDGINLLGLKEVLESKYKNVEAIDIPKGKNEKEQLEIFDTIYNSINDEEEIFFDVTHGLRSLPIQALAVLNYAEALKNISVGGIYYGAFEVGYERNGIRVAPVLDLKIYMDILETSFAAKTFVEYGISSQFKAVFDNVKKQNINKIGSKSSHFIPISKSVDKLDNFIRSINTMRGMHKTNYSNSTSKSIKESYDKFDETKKEIIENTLEIKPFNNIINYARENVSKCFENKLTNYEIGMATVEWCINYNMIQQGYTALNETIKTYVCHKYSLNELNQNDRENIANLALLMSEEINNVENLDNRDIEFIQDIHSALEKIGLIKIAKSIRDKRNDINHFGFRTDPASANTFANDLKKNYEQFKKIVENNE